MLALAEVPRVSRPYVGPFEVTLEYSNQMDPVVDLIGWKLLEPPTGGVGEEEWQLSHDGSIVSPSAS